ncbi:MAG: DNA polymerase III subunit delta' [Alphaproteobacteria bacterium]
MAARKKADQEAEDLLLPPEANTELIGQETAEAELLASLRSGRMHHAWLFTGAKGTGKATLAFRFARFVLRYGNDPAAIARANSLAVPAEDPISRQVASGAAQDLLVMRLPRDEKTGAEKSVIPVDEVRKLQPFFGLAAGAGGWRVAIVDSVDDLNRNAANALLKSLEEPPQRAVLLLLANAPGRLLPTIRSRCRKLHLNALAPHELAARLPALGEERGLPTLSEADVVRLASLAGGRIGRALELWAQGGLQLARIVDQTLGAWPDLSPRITSGLLDRAKADYELLSELIVAGLRSAAQGSALGGASGVSSKLAKAAPAAVLAELAAELEAFLARGESINMDERMMMGEALRRIAAVGARGITA